MKKSNIYITRLTSEKTLETKVATTAKYLQTRYELGSCVIATAQPELTYKLLVKQWQKLTRQMQQHRSTKQAAEDILSTTRTISRMQRVTFTTQQPDAAPNFTCYIVDSSALEVLPLHCFTVFALDQMISEEALTALPEDTLIVSFEETPANLDLLEKKSLEKRLTAQHGEITAWLGSHHIDLDQISTDIEKSNEALDTLLSSSALQTEFALKTKQYMQTYNLAQPYTLAANQEIQLQALKQLERQVRILSPAFLSDHITDSQSDEAFLLKDIASGALLTIEVITSYITEQYTVGRKNLAKALERKFGFTNIQRTNT